MHFLEIERLQFTALFAKRRTLYALGALLAWLAWTFRVRRRVVLDNLRLAFPEKSEAERRAIARATYRNLGRLAPEFLLVPRLTTEELRGVFVYDGWERYEAARALGRGVIACTAHFGNFELLAAAHTLRGVPITMISRKMGKSGANDLWRRGRARAGVEDLVVRRGETLRAARRALASGRVLGYVIDQNQPRRRRRCWRSAPGRRWCSWSRSRSRTGGIASSSRGRSRCPTPATTAATRSSSCRT